MHIFISYAKKDTYDLALRLRDALTVLPGVSAWMDESIPIGENWPQEIEHEIDRCDVMIVLLSPDIHRDPASPEGPSFVLKEVNYALYQVHKPVIPILAQPTHKPLVLADVQHIDLNSTHGNGMDRVVEEILRRAGDEMSARNALSPSLPEKKRTTQIARAALSPAADLPRNFPLPQPFEWCHIPAGHVTLEDASSRGGSKGGQYWVEAFAIGKYSITTAQYDVFIDDQDGYVNSGWWGFSPEAEQWRRNHPKPRGPAFEGADLPCTNVSWYEAVTFCRWLSSKTGLEITLPTGQQWQRAAQGDDGREYPWGDEFDPSRCNFGNNIGRPTPVTKYPLGASPYGVMNMSGNTWEWCLNEWGTDSTRLKGNGVRNVRGGSWGFYQNLARAASRNWHDPADWAVNQSFRIALMSPIRASEQRLNRCTMR